MMRLPGRHPLATVLLAALTLRVIAAFVIHDHVADAGRRFLIEGDANGYWYLGQQLAAGAAYSIYEPPRYALRMPGLPVVLAAVMTVRGDDVLAARLLLAVAGALACGLVYLLGCRLFDQQTGLAAGLWTAVSPTLVGFTPLILTETLFAAALTGSLLLLLHTLQRLDAGHTGYACAAATGLAVAIATYVRPTWLLAAPVFGIALLIRGLTRGRCLSATLLVASCAVALLPWVIRNHRVTGHVVVTTLWVGPSLYDGLSPSATGASDMSFVETDGKLAELGEYGANRYYTQAAIDYAADNPLRALTLAVRKLARFWSPVPNAQQFRSPLPAIACLIAFVPLMAFAGRGFWRARQDPRVLAMTAGPVLYFSLLHLVFVGSVRYRLPAEYPLSVLAAYGLSRSTTRGAG